MGLWAMGMVVGAIVFAIPPLKAAPPIIGLSANPWMSGMIIAIWAPTTILLARSQLMGAENPAREGLRMGALLCSVNILLDWALVVQAMGTGMAFYRYLAPWLAYLLLAAIPWLVGRSLAARA